MLEGWEDLRAKINLDRPLFFNSTYNVLLSQPPFKKCKGGIIGDQMGMGKTVMMISLILANRPKKRSKPTLVITPTSILNQWQEQIRKFAPSLRVVKYADLNRTRCNVEEVDVVLMTENMIRMQFKKLKDKRQNIFGIEFFRVIIDEAHKYKNSKTKMAEATCQIIAENRWCLSGTPA